MSGSYYDVVWCGLEMVENKQNVFSLYIVTNYSLSRLLMPRGSKAYTILHGFCSGFIP